jgi:hypothetical protein
MAMHGSMMRLALGGVILALGLGGCGISSLQPELTTTGSKGVQAKQTSSMFPSEPDFVWQYDVLAHPSDDPYVDYRGTETVRIENVRRQGDRVTVECRAIDTFTKRYRFPQVTMSGDKVELRGVTYWGTAASDVDDLSIDFLRLPLKIGTKWDDGGWVGEVKGRERVTVPTGTYEAWKISVIGAYAQEYTAVGTYWVAPGLGIVKSDLSVPGWNVESELIVAGVQR